jgi:hypothetical protein
MLRLLMWNAHCSKVATSWSSKRLLLHRVSEAVSAASRHPHPCQLGAALGVKAALVVLPGLAVHRDLASASVFVFTLLWSSEVFRFAMGHLKYR